MSIIIFQQTKPACSVSWSLAAIEPWFNIKHYFHIQYGIMHIDSIEKLHKFLKKKKTFHFTQSSFTLLLQHPTLENVPPVHKHHRICPGSPVLSPWCRTLFLFMISGRLKVKVVGSYDVWFSLYLLSSTICL